MLDLNPKNRLNACQILLHPWMQGIFNLNQKKHQHKMKLKMKCIKDFKIYLKYVTKNYQKKEKKKY